MAPGPFVAFCAVLGHPFAAPALLGQALTHRSWCAEHAGYPSNERLEFLGDAVLGLVVTDDIYLRLPETDEGQLSRIRASVVCATALAEMATELGVGEVLLLGKGEAASGGRERLSILADAMEAIIGAVYIDGGPPAATELVLRLVGPRLADGGASDSKSQLQEFAARTFGTTVVYEVAEHGPEHDKTFQAIARVDHAIAGSGTGRSKKQAEQAAARDAWRHIEHQRGEPPAREGASHG